MRESSVVIAEKCQNTIEVPSRSMKLFYFYSVVLILNTICRVSVGDEKSVGTLFQTHCVICHDATTQEGGFRVDALTKNSFESSDAAAWEKVFDLSEEVGFGIAASYREVFMNVVTNSTN